MAVDVEKPRSEALAAALKRALSEDADPMRYYQPVWYSGYSRSGGDFSCAVSSAVAGMNGALTSAVPLSSGSFGFSGADGGSGGGW